MYQLAIPDPVANHSRSKLLVQDYTEQKNDYHQNCRDGLKNKYCSFKNLIFPTLTLISVSILEWLCLCFRNALKEGTFWMVLIRLLL